ncbi:MAG: hypothetical protein ACTHME_05085 [Candidatus Nitrosocosmicus sp.]
MDNIYHGYFSDWDDVVEEFECNEKHPEEVIFAIYDSDGSNGYEADSIVIYRNGEKYFIVEGGHCSCYGLEGQWQPEEYTKHELKEVIKRKNFYPYDDSKSLIEELKKYVEDL